MKPLRPCLLWMDGRAAEQCIYIMDKAKGDPALMVNCGGCGPLSAEWMIPKALWVKQQEPEVWDRVEHVCDKQDYMNYLLTGKLCMSMRCSCLDGISTPGELVNNNTKINTLEGENTCKV